MIKLTDLTIQIQIQGWQNLSIMFRRRRRKSQWFTLLLQLQPHLLNVLHNHRGNYFFSKDRITKIYIKRKKVCIQLKKEKRGGKKREKKKREKKNATLLSERQSWLLLKTIKINITSFNVPSVCVIVKRRRVPEARIPSQINSKVSLWIFPSNIAICKIKKKFTKNKGTASLPHSAHTDI